MLKTYLYLFRNTTSPGAAATVLAAETWEQADEIALADVKEHLTAGTVWEAAASAVELPAAAGQSKFVGEERELTVSVNADGKVTTKAGPRACPLGPLKPPTNEELSA